MAIHWFEHVDADRNRLVGFCRKDPVVVSGRDQRAFGKETMDIPRVLVERRLLERLESMRLVLLIVPFLLEFQVCRAGDEMS
jgi:hypothetical protein